MENAKSITQLAEQIQDGVDLVRAHLDAYPEDPEGLLRTRLELLHALGKMKEACGYLEGLLGVLLYGDFKCATSEAASLMAARQEPARVVTGTWAGERRWTFSCDCLHPAQDCVDTLDHYRCPRCRVHGIRPAPSPA